MEEANRATADYLVGGDQVTEEEAVREEVEEDGEKRAGRLICKTYLVKFML